MKRFLDTQSALLGGACLLVLGLALVAFVAKVLDLSNDALLAIVFLFPLLAYLILTGQLTEFGAGGVTAKFRDAARKPVAGSVQRITVEEAQTVEKLGRSEIQRIDALDLQAPVVLSMVLGARGGKYRLTPFRQYVGRLQRFPRFKLVVFLDADARAVGYLPAETVAADIETEASIKPLIGAVNEGRLPPQARTEFLSVETTAEEALQRMTHLRCPTMPARNTDGTLAGVVEREDVLCSFLLDATRG